MKCIIKPTFISGEVFIPPSKSETMRAIVFASMAHGKSQIENILLSPDTFAMIEGVISFGARVEIEGRTLKIWGVGGEPKLPKNIINVGNSGLALRFLLAFAALVEGEVLFTGDDSIKTIRPVKPLLDVYRKSGMIVSSFDERKDGLLSVNGKLQPGSMMIDGQDSQPVSSLLFTTSFLPSPSEIFVLNAGEKPWVDLTMHWLEFVGAPVYHEAYRLYEVEGKASYDGFSLTIGGDYSTAMFPIAAAIISGGEMRIHGLEEESMQGDKKTLTIFKEMGAEIYFENGVLIASRKGQLKGVEVNINHCIDSLPILSVVAAFAETETVITGAAIAKLKECDRIEVMKERLIQMGAKVESRFDGMTIYPSKLEGAVLDGAKDHRVVLSLMVAATAVSGESIIDGAEACMKTFPTAIYEFISCGMDINLEMK